MLRKIYISQIQNEKFRTKFLLFSFIIVLVSNLILSFYVLNANTTEKTIVVPFNIKRSFSIEGKVVSSSYIEQMAEEVSQMLLTYQKENVKYRFNQVLRLVDPSIYSQMNSRFEIESKRIISNDVSSVFYTTGIHIDKNTAYVSGELDAFIGSQLVTKVPKTYEIIFNFSGSLMIEGFKEVKKIDKDHYVEVKGSNPYMIENKIINKSDNANRSE